MAYFNMFLGSYISLKLVLRVELPSRHTKRDGRVQLDIRLEDRRDPTGNNKLKVMGIESLKPIPDVKGESRGNERT